MYIPKPMIDKGLADFVEDGVGIHLATRSERQEPNGARAVAAQADADGIHLTVYLPTVGAGRVLQDLRANGQAALLFGRPLDARACQVKGTFVSERPAAEEERVRVMTQWDLFLANLERIGFPRSAFTAWATWPCTAIRVRVSAVFEQTPGPDAGAQLA